MSMRELLRIPITSITTNQEAGWFLGLNPTPASLNISVDEVAWKKHHRYWDCCEIR